MRRLIITENHGLWAAETSSGIRGSGATMESALRKLALTEHDTDEDFAELREIFDGIAPIQAGQIVHGQAGA